MKMEKPFCVISPRVRPDSRSTDRTYLRTADEAVEHAKSLIACKRYGEMQELYIVQVVKRVSTPQTYAIEDVESPFLTLATTETWQFTKKG